MTFVEFGETGYDRDEGGRKVDHAGWVSSSNPVAEAVLFSRLCILITGQGLLYALAGHTPQP